MSYSASTIYGNTTSAGSVTTGETTLATTVLDANQLKTSNDTIHVIAWGNVANNANVKTLTFYFGALSQAFVLPASAASSWRLEVWISCVSPTSQTGVAVMNAGPIASATTDTFLLTGTVDTKGTVIVKTTGTATATNDILQKGMLVLV